MSKANTARWVSRFVALAMVVVALLAFKIMERQLKRIGEAAERSEARVERERGREAALPQPPTSQLPRPRQAAPRLPENDLDSLTVAEEADPSRAAREEALPEPGQVPEGAVW